MARHLRPGRIALLCASLAAVALAAGSCGDTLLDHAADPGLLGPVCAAPLLACGGRCLSCSPPADASAACTAGACDFVCNGGFNRCGGASCIAESAASCGPSCAVCTPPPNATPVCTAAHACDFVCTPGWLRSGAGCARALAVSAGYVHSCALLADGRVRCWGANFAGQLGDGTHADAATPVDVAGLPGPASAIAAGYAHTCAIVAGAAWCWGDNTFGEIGDGTTVERPTPVQVQGLSQVVALAAGGGIAGTSFGHTCAVLAGGDLRCWGADDAGQLGDGGGLTQPAPVPVGILPAGTAVSAVACGERHTCALSSGGAVYCWGAFDAGQLGIGSASAQSSPAVTAVGIASGASAVAAGQAHSCAVVSGELRCWGLNSSGQVNAGDTAPGTVLSPVAPNLGGGFQATALGAGRAHTCALDTADVPAAAKCFGANGSGQLGGAGSKVDVNLDTPPPATAVSVTGGSDHTCALTAEGGVQCWGLNDHGQLGTGDPRTSVTAPAWVSGR
jgi:alpha-tubulin suppressor-like RCC1 family protein